MAGITLQFSLVPQSSLDEDYSCSVLMFGMHWLQRWDQEARLVSLIKAASDSSPDVELSHENGDYDILIISAEMALMFVDERKKGDYLLHFAVTVCQIHPCADMTMCVPLL